MYIVNKLAIFSSESILGPRNESAGAVGAATGGLEVGTGNGCALFLAP